MINHPSEVEHPILNPSRFAIETPMMLALMNQVSLWIWNGVTGALILGQYRIGKTKAISYLRSRLTSRLGQPIPSVVMTIPRRDRATIASLWKTLCFSVELTPKNRATADDMSNLLFHFFADLAALHNQTQVVLFVDEMQRLDISQMEVFAELYDRLAEAHVNLSTFFIGNKKAAQGLVAKAQCEKYELIRGRFFTQCCNYHGIRTKAELSACLKEYDISKFPKKTGSSYTSYFVGEKCGDDWKLASLSNLIWEVYTDNFRSALKLESWQMQYFVATIRILLKDYIADYGAENEDELRQMIVGSISDSGLVPSLVQVA